MPKGYLGIDAGTQGLSVVLTDESMKVVAMGEGGYEMVPGLSEGHYEQNPNDWWRALQQAMKQLRSKLPEGLEVLAIGISGQMHGEVLCDENGDSLGPARLWCDSRNAEEEAELTSILNTKMPKRMTGVRWLWTTRNRPELAERTRRMTTPSGWLAFKLTGQWNLGIGDAAGMFPIDQETQDFDQSLLSKVDSVFDSKFTSLADILPKVKRAGEESGAITDQAAQLLGLQVGIPVAAAEGDQPAAMAGSLIGQAGMVSCSFGTSVCANSVGDRPFMGVDKAVDHFCSVDGKPINMVWLRNGTTFMNTIVEMFGREADGEQSDAFEQVIPQVLAAPADCDGLLALPFMDDEPGLGVERGGSAMLFGLNAANAKAGNAVKAALLATMFNLKKGSEILDEQSYPRTEIVLTGGLTRTPQLGQILADVFNTPVTLLLTADEGTAWGAALLAKFRLRHANGDSIAWPSFLSEHADEKQRRMEPNAENVAALATVYQRYLQLLESSVK